MKGGNTMLETAKTARKKCRGNEEKGVYLTPLRQFQLRIYKFSHLLTFMRQERFPE